MLITTSPVALGNVKVKTSNLFEVPVTNTGTKPATVTSIFAGCQSCTTVAMKKSIIYPNETINVYATFTPTNTGSQSKTITLEYKIDEVAAKAIINFTANVSE